MKHFSIEEWTDYARGMAGVEHVTMQQHLSTCRLCACVVQNLSDLVVTSGLRAPDAPDYLVRRACEIFALTKLEQVNVSKLVAKLVYDSFREPLPAGVRSQPSLSRHILYEAGDYYVDVQVSFENTDSHICMIGQIVSKNNPKLAATGLPVVLRSGKNRMVQARTNELGEFRLEYKPGHRLRLHISTEPRSSE